MRYSLILSLCNLYLNLFDGNTNCSTDPLKGQISDNSKHQYQPNEISNKTRHRFVKELKDQGLSRDTDTGK